MSELLIHLLKNVFAPHAVLIYLLSGTLQLLWFGIYNCSLEEEKQKKAKKEEEEDEEDSISEVSDNADLHVDKGGIIKVEKQATSSPLVMLFCQQWFHESFIL